MTDEHEDGFDPHPLHDEEGRPLFPPPWEYPGPAKMLSQTEAYLIQQNKELRFLIAILLLQTGLPPEKIEEANEIAKKAVWETDQQMMDLIAKKHRATPEGQQAHAKAMEEHHERVKKMWRQDCIEDGRIMPDPTRKT